MMLADAINLGGSVKGLIWLAIIIVGCVMAIYALMFAVKRIMGMQHGRDGRNAVPTEQRD